MSREKRFTIEKFYENIRRGRISGGKCKNCGTIHLPPRPLCDKCYSDEFEWVTLPDTGMLLTYTIIHVATPQFQDITPYPVGIIQLGTNLKIPGIIKGITSENIKIGMMLKIDFEESNLTHKWPTWPRYYFAPTHSP